MTLLNRARSSAAILLLPLSVLMAPGQTAAMAPVQTIAGAGLIESRNEAIRIENGTTTDAAVRSRNGRISIGSDARVLSVDSRNGRVDVGARSFVSGAVSSRNGQINLGEGVVVRGPVETRNGALRIGSGSRVEETVYTRNGSVTIGEAARIGSHVESRNGGIHLRPGVVVEGSVVARNGTVRLEDARVRGNVDVVTGDIHLVGRTEIEGDLLLLMPEDRGWGGIWSFFQGIVGDDPVIRIGAEARILGRLIVDERARLEIAPGADVPTPIRVPSREAWLEY